MCWQGVLRCDITFVYCYRYWLNVFMVWYYIVVCIDSVFWWYDIILLTGWFYGMILLSVLTECFYDMILYKYWVFNIKRNLVLKYNIILLSVLIVFLRYDIILLSVLTVCFYDMILYCCLCWLCVFTVWYCWLCGFTVWNYIIICVEWAVFNNMIRYDIVVCVDCVFLLYDIVVCVVDWFCLFIYLWVLTFPL